MDIKAERKQKRRNQFKTVSAILKLVMLLIIVIGIPLYIYFFQHDLIDRFSDINEIEAAFLRHKTEGAFIYIGSQIVQIIICIIPGQVLQFAAGYIYGFGIGFLLSIVGAFLGSLATYYIAKILGHDAMHIIFGEERMQSLLEQVRGKKGIIVLFLIYLIPGVPKDLCNYAAGLSELKLEIFLIVSLAGRTPGMMGSLIVGHQIMDGDYTSAIVIACISILLFILGIIFRKKVMLWFDKAYDKLIEH